MEKSRDFKVIVHEFKGQRHTFPTNKGGAVSPALLLAQKLGVPILPKSPWRRRIEPCG